MCALLMLVIAVVTYFRITLPRYYPVSSGVVASTFAITHLASRKRIPKATRLREASRLHRINPHHLAEIQSRSQRDTAIRNQIQSASRS
ncbi:uncharacterized protein B0T15DRAFT_36608 [Chaetomium strumarium]|uniref:Uncharacterized protein n=1 Tax=Chaetomium strumarium TaxID=1170767 RepID=A0AAJ0H215_9PEZI|nr:hypothetical protein B0T15DRAFT_36608 [Chaetomium strumarium]